jgi:methylated-DNA-[protein]-cysteine S-methyltransferase
MNRSSKSQDQLYWTVIHHEDWRLIAAATNQGLCYVGSPNGPMEELTDWAARRLPGCVLVRDDRAMAAYEEKLTAYLTGGRREAPADALDLRGTPFQLAVWRALSAIPYGATLSYTDIASSLGKPAAVRAVGAAIGANPVLIAVPCHRVVGKNGALTGYRGGLAMKAKLLKLENSRIQG